MPQEVDVIKDVSIGSQRYQLTRIEARAGGLVLARLVTGLQKMLSGNTEAPDDSGKEASPESVIRLVYMNLSEEDATFVQNKILMTVGCYRTVGSDEVAIPVLKGSTLAIPELRTDIAALLTITQEALAANLAPFFTKAGLEKLFAATADSPR